MMHHGGGGGVHPQSSNSTTNGNAAISIVKLETDRPHQTNFRSSEYVVAKCTDVSHTNSSIGVDTTNAATSSSSRPPSQNEEEQQQHGITDSDNSYDNTNTFLSSAFSDYHLEPSLTASYHELTDLNLPGGGLDVFENWGPRLNSGSSIGGSRSETQSQQDLQGNAYNDNIEIQTTTTTENTTSAQGQQLPSAAAASSTQQTQSITTTGSTFDHASRMGYTDRSHYWSSAFEDGKMDRNHEDKNRDGDDSTVQSTAILSTASHGEGDNLSPASTPRITPSAGPAHDSEAGNQIGTPSTVSTAPSTEDASLSDSIDKLGLKLDPSQLEPFTLHRRAPSWDRSPMSRNLYTNTEISASHNVQPTPTLHQIPSTEQNAQYWMPHHEQQQLSAPGPAQALAHHPQPRQSHIPSSPWGNPNSRVASFRTEQAVTDSNHRAGYGFAQMPPQQHQDAQRWQQQQSMQTASHSGSHSYQQQQQQVRGAHMQEGLGTAHGHRPHHGYTTYPVQQPQQPHSRKSGFPPQHQQTPTAQSPARNVRALRSTPGAPGSHRSAQQAGGGPPSAPTTGSNSSRSPSEILKTLLRKKACLYEPDTSRAVALVTWLVGRHLALEFGYFSRQQLQAGVHACVAEKIESGTITRTKVNRCMQIILNSCFHYIIPRPDGTEEKGHAFRETFEKEVQDDGDLLQVLPEPWNNLRVERETVLEAAEADDDADRKSEPRSAPGTPHGSPKVKPKEHRPSPNREREQQHSHGDHHDHSDSKRAVLLCFNENVRAAEDVFRCHNEFIRDSAHSSNLQLTAQEWRIFFGKDAASTPQIWGNVGIPVVAVEQEDGTKRVDALGQMTPDEVGKFRSTWCAKRYDHDHEFCGMAHVEVNGGWLRRDPNLFRYKDEFCLSVKKTADKCIGPYSFVVNECPSGVNCEFAHSNEEIVYHPNRYKAKLCPSVQRTGVCRYGDICPHHHPSESARPLKKSGDGRPPSSRHNRSGQSGGVGKVTFPSGSPILYASPAPVSSYERHLHMPGLQNLFRRQSTVVRAHLQNPKCRCCYSYFEDDVAGDQEVPRPSARPRGLPPHRM